MPRIGRFPPFGKRFFRRARKLIGSCHFAHFWRAVVSLAAMQGRRSMRKLEASCRNHHTRQSIGFFLSKAHWDAPQLLAETAIDTLKGLGWKSGDALHFVLDDTQKREETPDVGRRHKQGRSACHPGGASSREGRAPPR